MSNAANQSSGNKKRGGCLKIFLFLLLVTIVVSIFIPKGKNIGGSSGPSSSDSLLTCYIRSEEYLKKTLKDPDSYEVIEKSKNFVKPDKSIKNNPYIQVTIKYRAKNSFGGYVIENRVFDFDKNMLMTNTFELK